MCGRERKGGRGREGETSSGEDRVREREGRLQVVKIEGGRDRGDCMFFWPYYTNNSV